MSASAGEDWPPRFRNRYGRRLSTGVVALIWAAGTFLSVPETARGWDAAGHREVSILASRVAASGAPDLPEFFLLGGDRIADASLDPDARRHGALEQLRSTEGPEHYLDRELLRGSPLPESRYDYLQLLADENLSPRTVGTVPYAIIEAMQNLTLVFAEHRRRPDDEFVQAKALVLAGEVSHYAADMSQPLHTTIHYNGRALPDTSSPRTGIHQLVDSLIGRIRPEFSPPDGEEWPRPFADTWTAVLEHLDDSHALVDRIYELEEFLGWEDAVPLVPAAPPAVVELTRERLFAAVAFTGRLFATAWVDSADLELPEWGPEAAQSPPE